MSRRSLRMPLLLRLALAGLGLAACEAAPARDEDAAGEPDTTAAASAPQGSAPAAAGAAGTPPQQPLVDSAHDLAVAGEDGWMYSRAATADLDGDGADERVVVMARAETREGRPLWDDGQPWQVYVEEPDGRRTHLYARYVQLGSVIMRVGLGEGDTRPSIVIVEHVPDRIALYELRYHGPGRTEAVHRYERMLDPRGEVASPSLPEF